MNRKYFFRIGSVYLMLFFIILGSSSGCKKFISVDPPNNQILNEEVYASDASAMAVINGLYSRMMKLEVSFTSGAITVCSGLSADELKSYSQEAAYEEMGQNIISPSNPNIYKLWTEAYAIIYSCNSIIESLNSAETISKPIKNQLTGEALFIRSFIYFNLVNLWGDLPLVLSTDYRINSVAARQKVAKIYDQIKSDLQSAVEKLTDSYPSPERVRPNRWVAKALLARVMLYTGDTQGAVAIASEIIDCGMFQLEPDLNRVFVRESKETIWHLMPVNKGYNTSEGLLFILNSSPRIFSLTSSLANAFHPNDRRRLNWIGKFESGTEIYFYPGKYKVAQSQVLSEYFVVFRLAEQYLIRAESNLKNGDREAALNDLNVIRKRAGADEIIGQLSIDSLKMALEHERRLELFCEWGHRWFDIKRSGRALAILKDMKSELGETDLLYPIPLQEILNNPFLIQNTGY